MKKFLGWMFTKFGGKQKQQVQQNVASVVDVKEQERIAYEAEADKKKKISFRRDNIMYRIPKGLRPPGGAKYAKACEFPPAWRQVWGI